MGEWLKDCDCCKTRIKRMRDEDHIYRNYNLDGSEHEKHYKIWAASVASLAQYEKPFQAHPQDMKIGDLTMADLESIIEGRISLRLGQYFHSQSGYKEKWFTPKRISLDGTDYYVAGAADGMEDDTIIELKTTWSSTRAKTDKVMERAKVQADIYSWMTGYKKARIIVKNLAKPKLDSTAEYSPDASQVEAMLAAYVKKNRDMIKLY